MPRILMRYHEVRRLDRAKHGLHDRVRHVLDRRQQRPGRSALTVGSGIRNPIRSLNTSASPLYFSVGALNADSPMSSSFEMNVEALTLSFR